MKKSTSRKLFPILITGLLFIPCITFGGLVNVGGISPQNTATNFLSSCDSTKTYAMYEGQKFRLYDTRVPNTQESSWEILDGTQVKVWNPYNVLGNNLSSNTLGGLLPTFFYKSNGKPGSTHFGIYINNVYTHKQDTYNYTISPSPATTRISPLAQVVHYISVRQITLWGGTSYQMTYLDTSNNGGTVSANPKGRETPISDVQCQNFHIAKCGDGVRDNPNKPGNTTTDGKSGILVNGQILPRLSVLTPIPAEECDGSDGTPSGFTCNSLCKLEPIIINPNCSLTPHHPTITCGQSQIFTYNSTNTTSITNPLNIPVTINPNQQGTFNVTPLQNTNYSFTANGMSGSTPMTCAANVTVNPAPQPNCSISANQTISYGQNAVINFDSTYTTSISNLQNISGGIIIPGQGGRFNVSPTQTTTYSFTVNGNNPACTAPKTCSTTITVLPPNEPTCNLTPAQQSIISGQSAILYYNSNNTVSISNLVNIPSGIIDPNEVFQFSVSPTQNTIYSFTANGFPGTTPVTCTGIITLVAAPQPILKINKTLINPIAYHSGDLVGWRIDFSNVGSGIAHGVVLTDYFPISLQYISSQLYGITPPYTFGTGMFGVNETIEYSGFDLAPGQAGYMIITGLLNSYALCNWTTNRAEIGSLEIQPPINDSDYFLCYTPSTNLTIDKTINKQIFYPGEYISFTIAVTNNGPDVAQSVKIGDVRPNASCILPGTARTSNMPMTLTNPNSPYERTLNTTLPVGQTVYLYLTGQVANTRSCAGNYVNTGTLTYVINNLVKTGIDIVNFSVPMVNVGFVKTIVQAGTTHGDPVVFAIDYINNGSIALSSYDITDYRPGTLTFLSASPMPQTQTTVPGGQILQWHFTTPLAPGGTGRILLNGKIN